MGRRGDPGDWGSGVGNLRRREGRRSVRVRASVDACMFRWSVVVEGEGGRGRRGSGCVSSNIIAKQQRRGMSQVK